MLHEHLAVSAFVVVHGALNSVFVSLLLILIELSMYSCVADVAELAPFRLQQSESWTKRVLCITLHHHRQAVADENSARTGESTPD